jgi:hypothetical protein
MDPVPILESVLTCPQCGFAATEPMPTNACIYFYECASCRTLLRPKPGYCCVFCSYGSVECPPVQLSSGCCVGVATTAES